jgi:hypothetical protein
MKSIFELWKILVYIILRNEIFMAPSYEIIELCAVISCIDLSLFFFLVHAGLTLENCCVDFVKSVSQHASTSSF